MILYGTALSSYTAKSRIALALKGVPYRLLPPPGGYRSAEYRSIVPAGTIPALVDGDLVLSESEAINEYLEDRFPDPPLLPADAAGRARQRQLSRLHDLRLEPPLRALFAEVAPATRDAAAVSRQAAAIAAALDLVAAVTRPAPFLGGAAPGLADCAYPATLFLIGRLLPLLGTPVDLPAALAPWAAALAQHPAVASVMAETIPATEAWLAGKLP
ncbi:MAG: hypothetical protein OHK0024_30820 [Thalassobaculales bacterium]